MRAVPLALTAILVVSGCGNSEREDFEAMAGRVRFDKEPPPSGGYLEPRTNWVSLASFTGCRRDHVGYLHCLPRGHHRPTRRLRYFAVAIRAGCGITYGGRLHCWYGDSSYDLDAGTGWIAVSGEPSKGCAVHRSGRGWCWPTDANPFPPGNDFVDVATTYSAACAARQNGSTHCWRLSELHQGELQDSPGQFVQISRNNNGGCGVTKRGQVSCWTDSLYDPRVPPMSIRRVEALEPAVAVDSDHVGPICSLGPTGAIKCVYNGEPLPLPFAEGLHFIDVSVNIDHVCAVTDELVTYCRTGYFWAENPSRPPTEQAPVEADIHVQHSRRDHHGRLVR